MAEGNSACQIDLQILRKPSERRNIWFAKPAKTIGSFGSVQHCRRLGKEQQIELCAIYKITRGSLFELETQIIISKELNFISDPEFSEIMELIAEESKMLNSFIKSISQ